MEHSVMRNRSKVKGLSVFVDCGDPIAENILKLLNARRFLIDRMIHSAGGAPDRAAFRASRPERKDAIYFKNIDSICGGGADMLFRFFAFSARREPFRHVYFAATACRMRF